MLRPVSESRLPTHHHKRQQVDSELAAGVRVELFLELRVFSAGFLARPLLPPCVFTRSHLIGELYSDVGSLFCRSWRYARLSLFGFVLASLFSTVAKRRVQRVSFFIGPHFRLVFR